jgi:hypothetical protein
MQPQHDDGVPRDDYRAIDDGGIVEKMTSDTMQAKIKV